MEEKEVKKQEKMTYDELENVATQLSQQNQQLVSKMNKMDLVMTRLSLLFKVVEHRDAYNKDFVKSCVDEIEELLTLTEEDKQ